ncbi:LPS export ABC transporter periplasmic protein LptC [Limoniibacter endophyticus]|nr:LPS export ABC transporter periplasmic protein LptC [Limoniibacter endophyticus]
MTGDGIVIERNRDFAKAQSHSRRVQRLKIILPALAVLLGGTFLAYTYAVTPDAPQTVNVVDSATSDGKLVMANPTLNGFTQENLPYLLTAARAIQDPAALDIITLEDVNARIPMDADVSARITAAKGIFNRTENSLTVPSPIIVETSDGKRAELQDASIDIRGGALSTSSPVAISMEGANLTANSMQISENGKIILFENSVRLRIDSKSANQQKTNRQDEPAQGTMVDAKDTVLE